MREQAERDTTDAGKHLANKKGNNLCRNGLLLSMCSAAASS